jgi:hypothetical protein
VRPIFSPPGSPRPGPRRRWWPTWSDNATSYNIPAGG